MTTTPRHINYKSDFILRERFLDRSGNFVPLPDGVDFELVYTVKHGHTFTASRRAGVYLNCTPDGDALLVIFKDHNLCEGTLRRELHLQLLNDLMPDGFQNVYYPADPAVELWQFATDSEGVVECDALAAYTRGLPFTYADFTPEQLATLKGDKGDPFLWSDFTPAQIDLLRQPATEAASLANSAAKSANTAAAEVREQAQNLNDTASEAVRACNASTAAAKSATGAADSATANALSAAAAANSERTLVEQQRAALEATGARLEQVAAPIPSGLCVAAPAPLTLGNAVPRFISAQVLPLSALQNIIFQSSGSVADILPSGQIIPLRPGSQVVHVIPTLGTRFYQSVTVRVVAPSLRLSAPGALRIDRAGNIRLT
ncbi:MAG: hypothetical protein NC301_08945 [Bacteroides sp.]|nr:hypothetical protein [Bacteroides sp.]MCM1380119.1 hypothetical protein [Bacteroides sp.]MCM1446447.1 hypothetical protein [Prevotella sp.]